MPYNITGNTVGQKFLKSSKKSYYYAIKKIMQSSIMTRYCFLFFCLFVFYFKCLDPWNAWFDTIFYNYTAYRSPEFYLADS